MRTFTICLLIISVYACHSSKNSSAAKTTSTPLTGTYWKLTELGGSAFTGKPGAKEVYLRLKSSDSTISGNGGCNGYGGKYIAGPEDRIKFSNIISTMMACEGTEYENTFFRTLENTDSYYISGDTLQLNRARMAPLAKFIAIHGKTE